MKKKKFNIRTLLIALIVLYSAGTLIKQELNAMRLNEGIDKANYKLLSVKQKGEQLKEQLDMAKTNPLKFGEKRARERLGLIMENETPVLPVPEAQQ